ncbi:hypothetical protein HDU96_002777, partial [Phlyctochytrium bullatum]
MESNSSSTPTEEPPPVTESTSSAPASKTKANWKPEHESYLVDLCLAAPKQATDNNLKKQGWTSITNSLNKHFKTTYTYEQVKSKVGALKTEHAVFAKLRDISGWGWNPVTMTVDTTNEQWDTYLASHPKHKKYRNKSFPMYEKVDELVNGKRATGQFIDAGTGPAPVVLPSRGPPASEKAQSTASGSEEESDEDTLRIQIQTPATASRRGSLAQTTASSAASSAASSPSLPPKKMRKTATERAATEITQTGDKISAAVESLREEFQANRGVLASLAAPPATTLNEDLASEAVRALNAMADAMGEGLESSELEDVLTYGTEIFFHQLPMARTFLALGTDNLRLTWIKRK